MVNKIYTLSSGIKIYILKETDYNLKKYVLCAVVEDETNKISDQVAMFEYSVENQSFEAIENKEIISYLINFFQMN